MKVLNTVVLALALTSLGAAGLSAQQAAISMRRAQRIALSAVPTNEGVKSSKLKKANGALVYEFDIRTPGAGHQEVRVDAMTGAIVRDKHEGNVIGTATHAVGNAAHDVGHAVAGTADKIFGKDEYVVVNPGISETRAVAIAKRRYPNSTLKDVDLERKHGALVWKVKLDRRGKGHEDVWVDASSGVIVSDKFKD